MRKIESSMRKRFCGVAAGVFILVHGIAVGETLSGQSPGLDYPQTISSEYLYKTGRIVQAPAGRRNFWDYLAFFAWPPDADQRHLFPAEEATAMRGRVRELARQLLLNSQESVAEEYVLTVNTFVNLNNLYKTSSLGRYISEQLIGELQLAGVEVIEVRKSAGLMIHEGHGEYGLSRVMEELSYVHASQAMVVGTYTYAGDQIFLNARLLRNSDGMVLSNGSLVFELDPVTGQMLADEAMPVRRPGIVRLEGVGE